MAGMCQNQDAATKIGSAQNGCVSAGRIRRKVFDRSSGAIQSRRTGFGNPRISGNQGAPSQISDGATIINSRCWTMWTDNKNAAKGSIGEASRQIQGRQSAKKGHGLSYGPLVCMAASQSQPTAQ